jgi:mannose-6-phosphate isomerase-like protein (cupin superfamily)
MTAAMSSGYLVHRPPPIARASGSSVTILVTAADSSGGIGMMETVSPPHSPGPPLHIHSREDETFYVVAGTGEFWLGETRFVCGPGSRIFGPRGVPHRYQNAGETDLKVLIVYSPGGFEQSFIDIAAMGHSGADRSATGDVMVKYGVTRV